MTRTMDRPATTNQPHHPAAQRLTDRLSRFLARYSIVALRVSLGLVILGFGALWLGAQIAPDDIYLPVKFVVDPERLDLDF